MLFPNDSDAKCCAENVSRRMWLKAGLCGIAGLAGPSPLCAQRGGAFIPMPVTPRADNPSIAYHLQRCARCGDCRSVCQEIQTVKGFANVENDDDPCVGCGQCINYCPDTGLTERFSFPDVARILAAKKSIPIAVIAPSVPVSVGEMAQQPVGTDCAASLIGALRQIGFSHVLDGSFAADITIMEEATELVSRLRDNTGPLPLITSCCPAHVQFIELFYPEWKPLLSTTKSPLMIHGALIKTGFAAQKRLDPKKIVTVAFAPCTAKKGEILRSCGRSAGRQLGSPSMRDIDFSLTTRETAYLLSARRESLDVLRPDGKDEKPENSFDSFTDHASSDGTGFGRTGGVAEALLRTAYFFLNKSDAPDDFFDTQAAGGIKGVRKFTAEMKSRTLRVAVVHGLGNARDLFDAIKSKKESFDVIEVMACRGGCLGGGGQPRTSLSSRDELRSLRIAALQRRSAEKPQHTCHANPSVNALYADFLSNPGSETARSLLHTE